MTNTNLKTMALCFAMALAIGCADEDRGKPESGGDPTGTATPTGDGPDDPGAGAAGSAGGPVSLGLPAMCTSDGECPSGVACIIPDGGEVGYCDVDEMQVEDPGGEGAPAGEASAGGGASLGAPAPCTSDADCGQYKCVQAVEDGPMFCDVQEMSAQP
ncbi:MAG: hypothetical protein OEZ06_03710 [Myxococcales bacterium]|nr:hypothetical protein [Myxococcales bacterium]